MTTILERGQIWEEAESLDARKVVAVDHAIDLITWTTPRPIRRARSFRESRIRTFKTWIRRTKAELVISE